MARLTLSGGKTVTATVRDVERAKARIVGLTSHCVQRPYDREAGHALYLMKAMVLVGAGTPYNPDSFDLMLKVTYSEPLTNLALHPMFSMLPR